MANIDGGALPGLRGLDGDPKIPRWDVKAPPLIMATPISRSTATLAWSGKTARLCTHVLRIAACLALFTAPDAAPAADQPMIAPAALREDLNMVVDTLKQKHPLLSHSVTRARFARAVRRIDRQLDHPMDQVQAWATLAQLNPILADGHLVIGFADWRGDMATAIKQGTGLFPFEVLVGVRGYPIITSALGGGKTPLAGRQIRRINGQDARAIARELLARVHGDTPQFRAALLSLRWSLFFWKMYGAPAAFDLQVGGTRGITRIEASHTLPHVVQRDQDFDSLYQCTGDGKGTARMTVSSFLWKDEARYFRFTHDCFAQIKAAAADRLIIDVSANGGGNDNMWKDGILRYIATRPYKQGSTYVKREATGEVTKGRIQSDTVPPTDEPLHFNGKISVVIGPGTYSSSVLFANVMKDYGFATLIGTGGFARTTQTGGLKDVTLPNTGLILSFPRFVLDRPSGAARPVYLQPDLVVSQATP